jgi:hypothetical protein
MHKSLRNLFSPSPLFLLTGAHPFSIPIGGGSIQVHLLFLPFPAQLLDLGGAAPGNSARVGRVRKEAARRAGRAGSARRWRPRRGAGSRAARRRGPAGPGAERAARPTAGGSGSSGRLRRKQARAQQAVRLGWGARQARVERSAWTVCGARGRRAGVARAGAAAAARRRPEQRRAVLGRRVCRHRAWRPELAACRTGEHRGVDRTLEDLEVTDAEPVKWERVKDARGSDICRCDAARPK